MSDELEQARASIEHLRGDVAKLRAERDLLAESLEPYGECAYNCDCGDHAGPRSCGCHVTGEEARTWIRQQATEIDTLSWLRAEAVWQRNEARERADKRLVKYVAVADELDAQKALRASAVQLPESWVGNLWNTLATRIDDLDNLNDAYEAVKHVVESWRPATVEAAPEPLRWEHAYSCVCGQPDSPGVVHRISGPCYADETSAGVSGTGTEASDGE